MKFSSLAQNLIRLVLGGLFIFSGVIKMNDPLGFSYKLEEYFGADVQKSANSELDQTRSASIGTSAVGQCVEVTHQCCPLPGFATASLDKENTLHRCVRCASARGRVACKVSWGGIRLWISDNSSRADAVCGPGTNSLGDLHSLAIFAQAGR